MAVRAPAPRRSCIASLTLRYTTFYVLISVVAVNQPPAVRSETTQQKNYLMISTSSVCITDSLDTRYSEVLGVLPSLYYTLIESPATASESSYVEIFLNTENNLHWLYGDGASSMFPAAWADFTAPINHSHGSINDVLTAYAELLHAEDEFTRLQAARAWNLWEYRLSVADSQATQAGKTRPSHELSNAQIEHHYLSQYCFFDPKIFDRPNAELDAIPMYLLHGANDYVCPLE